MPAKRITLLLVVLLCAGTASGGVIYNDLGSFLGAMGPNYYLETFNSTSGTGASRSFSGNGYSYTASAPQGIYAGAWAGDGKMFGVSAGGDTLTIAFTGGNVTAVGGYFFLTNTSNAVIPGTLTLTFSDGTVETLTSTSPVSFFGYTSAAPLTSLVIGQSGYSWVSLDNLYTGTAAATPEPATAALAGLGLLAGAAFLRRRARRPRN